IVENGLAILYFSSETPGEIEITITKPNYYPFIETIDVVSENIDIGLDSFETIGNVISGDNIQLAITLKNYGSQTVNSV
ncbi:MAG: hypothetical protein KAT74_06015, partial [Candidatus Cloacimonetes bacterium]|nr:hypothetical protein [Candidatus Cloacimonadota bacterium]